MIGGKGERVCEARVFDSEACETDFMASVRLVR